MIYRDAEDEKAELAIAIENFRENVKGKMKISSDDSKIFTWNEVISCVEELAARKNKRLTCLEKFFDKVGQNGPSFNNWLELLPSGDYSSVNCGTFKLVINVGDIVLLLFFPLSLG